MTRNLCNKHVFLKPHIWKFYEMGFFFLPKRLTIKWELLQASSYVWECLDQTVFILKQTCRSKVTWNLKFSVDNKYNYSVSINILIMS